MLHEQKYRILISAENGAMCSQSEDTSTVSFTITGASTQEKTETKDNDQNSNQGRSKIGRPYNYQKALMYKKELVELLC